MMLDTFVRDLRQAVRGLTAGALVTSQTLDAFGIPPLVAFLLAVVGIYAVLAWAVSQRLNEIGVRMALGARAADIGRMILGQGGKLIGVGLVVGVVGAVALGRVLASQLPRVGSFDPLVLGLTVVALGGAALLASWLPARRAACIEPLTALRAE